LEDLQETGGFSYLWICDCSMIVCWGSGPSSRLRRMGN